MVAAVMVRSSGIFSAVIFGCCRRGSPCYAPSLVLFAMNPDTEYRAVAIDQTWHGSSTDTRTM